MIFTAPDQMIPAIRATGLDVQAVLSDQVAEPLVYLLDSAGASFGYRYEWDAFGPHSRELAADLADLTPEDLEADQEPVAAVAAAAERVTAILDPPDTVGLTRPVWLRLLAVVDYLQQEANLDLTNGDRPPYVKRNFEDGAIAAAKERVPELHR